MGSICSNDVWNALYIIQQLKNVSNRIYNRALSIAPSLPDESSHLEIDNNQLFSVIYMLKKLITDSHEWNVWVTQLEALIEAYPEVDLRLIGFKSNCVDILRNDVF